MDKKRAEHILDVGIKVLKDFLPDNPGLYFPLLYSLSVWVLRRIFDLKERVFAWQVWLDPEMVASKPDPFILQFYEGHQGLRSAFAAEIAGNDVPALRKAFPALYPVCGLEDAFLIAIFEEELESGDYRKIVDEFEARALKAVADIQAAGEAPAFWKGIRDFGTGLASLGLHFLSDAEIRKIIRDRIRKRVKSED